MSKDTSPYERFESPLVSRYAGEEMSRAFSPAAQFRTWRRIWLALAEAEKELGLPITDEQIAEMRAHLDDINFERAEALEQELRHDVMAHVHAFGEQCPKAKAIIHLGATSCDIGDNADLVAMREGLDLLERRLLTVDRPPGPVCRRAPGPPDARLHALSAGPADDGRQAGLPVALGPGDGLRGGGRRAPRPVVPRHQGDDRHAGSFLRLFDGDHAKVKRLDRLVAQKMGFDKVQPVTGQTYSRKVDAQVLAVLSGIAQSAHKFANDLRLLANLKEIEEPFEKSQVGSSAMAYKRNPMRSRADDGPGAVLMAMEPAAAATAAEQWLERTLDDSAARRIVLGEGFLAADAILRLYQNIVEGLVVYPKMIARHIAEELPFMATENILMAAVKAGGDRQALHERIRRHSQEAARQVKMEGGANDLLDRLKADAAFAKVDIDAELDPSRFVGRARAGRRVPGRARASDPGGQPRPDRGRGRHRRRQKAIRRFRRLRRLIKPIILILRIYVICVICG